jgi:hypothetical protein
MIKKYPFYNEVSFFAIVGLASWEIHFRRDVILTYFIELIKGDRYYLFCSRQRIICICMYASTSGTPLESKTNQEKYYFFEGHKDKLLIFVLNYYSSLDNFRF